MSAGKVNILTGGMGMGKTTYIKENFLKITKRKKYVFARVKNDYDDVENVQCFTDFEKFMSLVFNVTDSVVVIDEAYTVLPKELNVKRKIDEMIAVFLVNSRKLNNFVFILNHSLKQTYLWELDYTDTFIRFNTNDLIQHQRNRFISFPPVTDSLEAYPKMNKFEFDEIKIR